MPGVARTPTDVAVVCTSGYPTTNASTGSGDTYVNNNMVHRLYDEFDQPPHTSPRKSTSGSTTVYCNNLAVTRMGDDVTCCGRSRIVSGSGDVMAGG